MIMIMIMIIIVLIIIVDRYALLSEMNYDHLINK